MKEYLKGGMGEGRPDSAFDKKQLRMGIRIEKEHTPNPKIAKEIAKDHLTEFPDYYTYLEEMEKEMVANEKKKIYKF